MSESAFPCLAPGNTNLEPSTSFSASRRISTARADKRLDERIQRAVKKNAAFDIADFARLGAQLEYFDLRELQDTIVSKIAWPKFEGLFVNKEMLLKRFDQIAELRNAIRHSRSVDQITRKDGEAALIWFEQVLEKRRPAQSVLGMEHMRQ